MKKLLATMLLIFLLSTLVFSAAQAEMSGVDGTCPPPFHAEMAHDHDEHHGDHLHVGTKADLNGDGWICVFHAPPDGQVHVHIDNNLLQ